MITRDDIKAKLEEALARIQHELKELETSEWKEEMMEEIREKKAELIKLGQTLSEKISELNGKSDEEIEEIKEEMREKAQEAKAALTGFINRMRGGG